MSLESLPSKKGEWTETQRAWLEPHERAGRPFTVLKTVAQHPDLAKSIDALALAASTVNPPPNLCAVRPAIPYAKRC